MSRPLLEKLQGTIALETAEDNLIGLPTGSLRMYAIAFDLDTAQLQREYPGANWQNAYHDIRKVLLPLGFEWKQNSVYFGTEEMNAVKCVLAAQALSQAYPCLRIVCAIYECFASRN